jgi:hypothetical protein
VKQLAILVVKFESPVPIDSLVSTLSDAGGFTVLGDWAEYHQKKMLARGLTSESHPWQSLLRNCEGKQILRVSQEIPSSSTLIGHLDNIGMIIGSDGPKLSLDLPVVAAIRNQLEKVAILTKFEAA